MTGVTNWKGLPANWKRKSKNASPQSIVAGWQGRSMLRPYGECGSIFRRGSLAPISPERPAHAKGGIKTVRAIGVKVCRTQGLAVTSQPIHLMLCRAQFEVSRQFETDSNRTIVSNRQDGRGVSELGDISSEAESGFEEQKKMPRWSAANRLKLDVSAQEIACVGRAQGSRPARAGRLGKHAASHIRFVVRGRDGEIGVTADPVMRKKCA